MLERWHLAAQGGPTSGWRRILGVVHLRWSQTASIVLVDQPVVGLSDQVGTQLSATERALAADCIGVGELDKIASHVRQSRLP